jgi:hypothetical protein
MPMMLSSRIVTAVFLFAALVLPSAAQAHRFAPSLLKIVETTQHAYNVVWKTPTEATSSVPLRPIWPATCQVTSESPAVREGTGTIVTWTLGCEQLGDSGLVGHYLGVSGLAENQAAAMIMLTLRDGRDYQRVVNAEKTQFLVPAVPSQAKVMTEYSILGIQHIWGGIDHLMFVFGLLLLVGGGARLFWTITAFTAGHSITLALVTLTAFDYPVALIEFAIALSIFILALELARGDSPATTTHARNLFRRHPWWLAGGFGLLHGMGFAGALAEIGLPQSNVPLALLFFNIGIEIGQIAFVLLAIGAWWLISRAVTVKPARIVSIAVYMLGGLSAMWCIERGLDLLG